MGKATKDPDLRLGVLAKVFDHHANVRVVLAQLRDEVAHRE